MEWGLTRIGLMKRAAAALAAGGIAACAGAQPDRAAPRPAPAASATPAAAAAPDATRSGLAGAVQGPDGKPVDGAVVAAIPAGGFEAEPAGVVRSSQGGRFRFEGLAPGRYAITATAPGVTGAYLDVVSVAAGETKAGLTLSMGGEGVTIRGVVLAADGRPARGASVHAIRFSDYEGDIFIAEADDRGAYSVKVPLADYAVMARVPGESAEPQRAAGDKERSVDRTPERSEGSVAHVVDIRLSRVYSMEQPAPPEVIAWLKRSAIPLATAEAGHGFADMQPLRDVVGSARIVSLGEATHGTREFFQLKHRMLEFLVTEMGFTLFGIEATFPESLAINEYVLTGKGDPADGLSGLRFWTWDTEEVLELIRWMRRYNEDPKHTTKIKFYGFDMQSPPVGVKGLVEYLRKVDRPFAAEAERILSPLASDFDADHYGRRPKDVNEATASGLASILARLDKNRALYEKRSGEAAWKIARLHAQVVAQGERLTTDPNRFDLRDRSMAENVKALLDLEGPGAKAVLWAHNGHVSRSQRFGMRGMGSHLHDMFGAEQVVFGFSFNQGSFRAMQMPFGKGNGLIEFTVPPLPPGSLDATLARVGSPFFALDLRKAAADSAASAWLGARLQSRSIGAGFSSGADRQMVAIEPPRQAYDALLFVERTAAARGTPMGTLPPRPWPIAAAPVNLDLEEGTLGEVPAGWRGPPARPKGAYQAALSDERPRSGKRCAVLRRDASPWSWGYGTLAQKIDATPLHGKRVRLRAGARAETAGLGNKAALYLEATLAGGRPGGPFASAAVDPAASKGWRDYDVEIVVPADAETLVLGIALAGNGRAFVDDVSFQVVGEAGAAK